MRDAEYPQDRKTSAPLQPVQLEFGADSGIADCLNLPGALTGPASQDPEHPGGAPTKPHEAPRTGGESFAGETDGAGEKPQPDRSRSSWPTTAKPVLQKGRTRSNCRCGGPCFFCGDALPAAHDHDHFPIAWRFGGRHTVPACKRCHRLKDLVPLSSWPPSALDAAANGLSQRAAMAAAFVVSRIEGKADEPVFEDDPADLIFELVDSCTTVEARIAVAAMSNAGLDRERPSRSDVGADQ